MATATDLIVNASVLPVSELISQAVRAAYDTVGASRDVLVQRHSFTELAAYLHRLVPILNHLLTTTAAAKNDDDDDDASIAALAAAAQILAREVDAARALALEYGKRNRLYLLLNCRRTVTRLESATREIGRALSLIPLASLHLSSAARDEAKKIADDMARAEYRAAAVEEEIMLKVDSAIQEHNSDGAYANSLLALIAEAVGISKDRAALKEEFKEFKKEVADAKLRKDIAEAIQMDQIIALLSTSDATLSFKEKEEKYFSKRNSLGSQPLEPLQSFYCPITRDVMEDPVQTSSGQTFERSAIERWFADGNAACPLTMTPLNTGFLRPNITLRKSIEEWKERNNIIIISSMQPKLMSSDSEDEVLRDLAQLKQLCEEKYLNRECMVMEKYFPVLVAVLGRSNPQIRIHALHVLRLLVEDNNDNREKLSEVENAIQSIVKSLARRTDERKVAVSLLLELSKCQTVCDRIGKVQGCILLVVTISNSDNNQAADDARELLENLAFLEDNVMLMAKAYYFRPLLQCLNSGPEAVKKKMVLILAELELTDRAKESLFIEGVLQSILQVLALNDVDTKTVAIKALQKLSSFGPNSLQIIREGAVAQLLDLLFQTSLPISIRELVAATILNIATASAALQRDDALGILKSDAEISQLFSLVILTGPHMQRCILGIFFALCRLPSANDIRTKLRQFSAIQLLVTQCEHKDDIVRASAVKLLSCLMEDRDDNVSSESVSQRFLETLLSIIRKSKDEEEVAAALGIISNLPRGYTHVTQWLIDASAIATFVSHLRAAKVIKPSQNHLMENSLRVLCHFAVSTNLECQKIAAQAGLIPLLINFLEVGSPVAKRYAATLLCQFSKSSLSLSRPLERRGGFFCFAPPPEICCPVHNGVCSVETSFCLIEADAVRPLISLLGESDLSICDAALSALSTLIEAELLQSGTKILHELNGIAPVIKLLSSSSSELQEKILNILDRIFRLGEYKQIYGASLQMPLVEKTQSGNGPVRALSARILSHLNVLPNQSSYF